MDDLKPGEGTISIAKPERACSVVDIKGETSPGPWRVNTRECDSEEGETTEVVAANNTVVCDNEPYYPTGILVGDAPLIAASPTLYKYLSQALLALDESQNVSLCADIRKALKQASPR